MANGFFSFFLPFSFLLALLLLHLADKWVSWREEKKKERTKTKRGLFLFDTKNPILGTFPGQKIKATVAAVAKIKCPLLGYSNPFKVGLRVFNQSRWKRLTLPSLTHTKKERAREERIEERILCRQLFCRLRFSSSLTKKNHPPPTGRQPDWTFEISEPQNQSIDILKLHKICRLTDFQALEFWNVRPRDR